MSLNLITQLWVDGGFVTYPSYSEHGWLVRTGPDIESGSTPNRIEFTLANDDLSMDPSNVESSLYGKIGANTRTRLRINDTTLTWAEASSWEPDRTVDHDPGVQGMSWVTLTAEGLLRRLGRWEDPLDSPMRRLVAGYGSALIGHWPLEDASDSPRLTNDVAAKPPGTYSGTVTLAGDEGAGGTGPCVLLGADGAIRGEFTPASGHGYQIVWACKLPSQPSSATYETIFQWADLANRTWVWQANNANFAWEVTASDGTVLESLAVSYGTTTPNQWLRYRVKVTVSGGTLTYEPAWYVQDGTVLTGTTGTFSTSVATRPRRWVAQGNAWTTGAAYASVFAVNDTSLELLDTGDVGAFDGFRDERAGTRFLRLMSEFGLQGYIDGDADQSAPMGRQRSGKALDLLEECARTDGGVIYDEPVDIAISYRCHSVLINRAVSLALTYGVDVAPPLRKQISDVRVANDITATNWDGTTARAELTTGAKSTQVPPNGVGRYRLPLDVSVSHADIQLADRTNWELRDRTVDRPRYPAVVLLLHALDASYTAAVTGMRPGDLISLAGVEPDTIYLRVMNIERRGNAVEDIATLNCLPADVWITGEYDDGVSLYDSSSTTLGVARDATQTSWTFSTTDIDDLWSTTGEPYDVLVAGERITVTSMGAASGSGPYTQTATVTRSVNGVVKSQALGAEIHVFRPGRWALGGV